MTKAILILLLLLGGAAGGVYAQSELAPLPGNYAMQGLGGERQGWNNCGPATLTNALKRFGYADDQNRAANWLKPDGEDKNVSPWQMAEFVNTRVPELPVYALVRGGGTIALPS